MQSRKNAANGSARSATSGYNSAKPAGNSSGTNAQAKQGAVAGIKPRTVIKHGKFGEGTVIAVKGGGKDMIIDVAFKGVGIKSLVLRLAPIEVVE